MATLTWRRAMLVGMASACMLAAGCSGGERSSAPSPASPSLSPTVVDSGNGADDPSTGPGWKPDRDLPRIYREACREKFRYGEMGVPLDRSERTVRRASFTGRQLCANFYKSDLANVRFDRFYGSDALFRHADLEDVSFVRARLHFTDFVGATFRNVEFRHVSLFNANFENARLNDVTLVDVVCPSGVNSDSLGGTCFGEGMGP